MFILQRTSIDYHTLGDGRSHPIANLFKSILKG